MSVSASFATVVASMVALGAASAALGCGDGAGVGSGRRGVPATEPGASGTPSGTPSGGGADADADGGNSAPDRPAPPELADAPAIDLLDNRYRLHMFDAHGALTLAIAGEGLRKYDQSYRSPWGPSVAVDGRVGRVLTSERARLRFPADTAGPARIRIRIRGLARRQRLRVRLGRVALGVVALDRAWQVVTLDVPGPALVVGENQLELSVSGRGRVGRVRGRALIHSVDVIPAESEGSVDSGDSGDRASGGVRDSDRRVEAGDGARNSDTDGAGPAWPPLAPVVREPDSAAGSVVGLGGASRLVAYVEVPETAWLDVTTEVRPVDGGDGDRAASVRFVARVRAAEPGCAASSPDTWHTVLEREQAPGPGTRHRVSLAPVAGCLAIVELRVDGADGASGASSSSAAAGAVARAMWRAPRIALERRPTTPRPPPARGVILFVVDALRADKLPLYGDTRVHTAHIDRAAARGAVVFAHHQATSPSSPPSHATLHTGALPRLHGVTGDETKPRAGVSLLSAVLGEAGIATAYVGNNNFAMGRLKAAGRWTLFREPVFRGGGVDCKPLIAELLTALDDLGVGAALETGDGGKGKGGGDDKGGADNARRFFLSALPLEPHLPYRYHEGITDRYFAGPFRRPIGKRPGSGLASAISAGRVRMDETRWDQLRALYEGEVHYVDDCFGQMMDGLAARGLADTAIVLTSDHGEGLGERGRVGHAYGHFGELSNVPLIVMSPALGGRVRRVDVATSHVDVTPTVLALMGVDAPATMQGRDVLALGLRDGPWTPRAAVSEYGKSYAIRTRRWKYIVGYSGDESLYDTAADPLEVTEAAARHPAALRYAREAAGFFLAHRSRWRAVTWGTVVDHGPGFIAAADAATPSK